MRPLKCDRGHSKRSNELREQFSGPSSPGRRTTFVSDGNRPPPLATLAALLFGGQAPASGGSTEYFFPDKADFASDLSIRHSGKGG